MDQLEFRREVASQMHRSICRMFPAYEQLLHRLVDGLERPVADMYVTDDVPPWMTDMLWRHVHVSKTVEELFGDSAENGKEAHVDTEE